MRLTIKTRFPHNWVVLLLGVFASSLLASQSRTFRFAMNTLPQSLDPLQSGSITSTRVVQSVYEALFEYKYLTRPFELKPNLAAAMPQVSENGTVLKIPVKRGVSFIDDPCFSLGRGRELTAEDVVYSISRHFDPKNHSAAKWVLQDYVQGLDQWDGVSPIKGLRALDRYTVEFRLTKAVPFFLDLLAMSFAVIVPREAVEHYGRDFARHPVGTGPWVLKSMDSTKIFLVRNRQYRREVFNLAEHGYEEATHGFTGMKSLEGRALPMLDRVEIFINPEDFMQWQSFLKKDEIQYTRLPPTQGENVFSSTDPLRLKPAYESKYKAITLKENNVFYLAFNMASPLFGQDPNPEQNERKKGLRCAMKKAFDWPLHIKKFYMGLGHPLSGIVPPDVQGYSPAQQSNVPPYDLEGAKALLKKYGWTKENLPVFKFSVTNTVRTKQSFENYRHSLIKIGYPKEKIHFDGFVNFNELYEAARKNKLDFLGDFVWYYDYPDALNGLSLFYGPYKSPGANLANYMNPKFDAIYEKIATSPHSPERNQLVSDALKILEEDCLIIGGYPVHRVHLWHKNVIMYPVFEVIGSIFKYIDIQ